VPVDYRILVIAANVLANQLGLPVPVIPTLIVGGALAAQGTISPAELFAGQIQRKKKKIVKNKQKKENN